MKRLLYRGINSRMYNELKGQLVPSGNHTTAELFPSEHLFPSERLFPGNHARNAVDKHQNFNRFNEANFKNKSAYLSTTPRLERAQYYATAGNKELGYVFVIDRARLKEQRVSEYIVSEIATIVTIPVDEEVLLLTNPVGSPLPMDVILEVRKVCPIT